jgi:hypothetical protein
MRSFTIGYTTSYYSLGIVTVITPRALRWAECAARMAETRTTHTVLVGKHHDASGDIDVYDSIILKRI